MLMEQALALEDYAGAHNPYLDEPLFGDWSKDLPPILNAPASNTYIAQCGTSIDQANPEYCEISSDTLLNYIQKILMDEDTENKGLAEPSALVAAERSLYEVIGQKYPPSPVQPPLYNAADRSLYEVIGQKYPPSPVQPPLYNGNSPPSPDDGCEHTSETSNSNHGSSSSNGGDNGWDQYRSQYDSSPVSAVPPQVSRDPSFSNGSQVPEQPYNDMLLENFRFAEMFSAPEHISQFKKGMEEANKFLPKNDLLFDLGFNTTPKEEQEQNKFLSRMTNTTLSAFESLVSNDSAVINLENYKNLPEDMNQMQEVASKGGFVFHGRKNGFVQERAFSAGTTNFKSTQLEEQQTFGVRVSEGSEENSLRRSKNLHREDSEVEDERSSKQTAVSRIPVKSEFFDDVLLCNPGNCDNAVSALRQQMQETLKLNSQTSAKGSNGSKSRAKKQGKKDVVDLRSTLIHCAQSVATDDYQNANQILKQVRQHCSSQGDATQRLAHYFAESLESRLAGTGSQIYTQIVSTKTSAAEILKAYQLYLAACPFKKLAHFYANATMMNACEGARKIHVVDFGINYGFQWPSFIQRLSTRSGGPPKLRMTGIDFPQAGFRPADWIEDTGHRLAEYAQRFNVPFEYKAIAANWDDVKVEDLNLDKDEVLIVSSLFRIRHVADETTTSDSPRNVVLNNIRKMNPKLFIFGIQNGAYGAPFFITRFREALFHFSALFDMLEANVPPDHPQRNLLEAMLFGREILNVIACEGSKRIERPETYKQWHVRVQRAGMKSVPLDQDFMKIAREKVRKLYHKDFVVDEDGHWLLQGWKGRITMAMSVWVPDNHKF